MPRSRSFETRRIGQSWRNACAASAVLLGYATRRLKMSFRLGSNASPSSGLGARKAAATASIMSTCVRSQAACESSPSMFDEALLDRDGASRPGYVWDVAEVEGDVGDLDASCFLIVQEGPERFSARFGEDEAVNPGGRG
jgi:hypothetical protein